MKKIFNLILAALVIIGAASCTKNEEIAYQGGEGLSFYAEIVNGDTRAYIDDSNNDKVWDTIWENGDEVSVRGAGKTFTFTYDGAKFTCTADGVTSIVGETVTISPTVYHFADAKAGKNGWSFNTTILTFTEGMTVPLEANTSYFRYTYNGDKPITFTVEDGNTGHAGTNFVVQGADSYSVAYSESITFDGGTGENFIAYYFGTNKTIAEATLSYSIDGVKCKEVTMGMSVGKVYNLGDLSPVASLSPNEEWNEGNARFAAFFFGNGETWVDMTDADSNGIYECAIPAGYPNVIFCRMNPDKAENNWDNKWNQTPDLVVKESYGKYYYITGWNIGEWQAPDFEFPAITTLYLKPNANWLQANARFAAYFFNDNIGKNKWVDMTDTNSDGIYEVTIPTDFSYPNVIFCRMDPNVAENSWTNGAKWNQTSNLTIPTRRNNLYTINDGSWDAGWWSIK